MSTTTDSSSKKTDTHTSASTSQNDAVGASGAPHNGNDAADTSTVTSHYHIETVAVHAAEHPNVKEGGSGDVVTPIHLATTFARQQVDVPTAGYEYSRSSNPTRTVLEGRLAALERARYALAFSSGVAAQTTIVLSLVKSGDHVIVFDDVYGGTRRLFTRVFAERYNVTVDYVDATDVKNIERILKPNTSLVWLETPTNPLLKICDVAAISQLAHTQGTTVVVDNTFASPFFQNPLELGADIVHHSTTKYLGGHSDTVGGCIMTNDDGLYQQIKFVQNSSGAILSPFDSYLLLRGTKTLPLRMERCAHNAQLIAEFLERSSKVKQVLYPGLASHTQHKLAAQQMCGFSGMISFYLNTSSLSQIKLFLARLQLFAIAESLGAVESLIEHPAIMTHASVPQSARAALGISDSFIRISVGVEHSDDLIADLDQALSVV